MPFLKNKYEPRLLPQVVDERARSSPNDLFGAIPVSTNIADGFRDITYSQLANSINKCAHWFEVKLGRSDRLDTVAYMGPNDIGYHILTLGLAKAGYKTFLPSPRNSLAAQLSLLDRTNCDIFLLPHTIPAPLQAILKHRTSLRTVQLPERITDWLDGEIAPEYPWNVTYEQVKHDAFLVLHTSGSTGLPKPIDVTYGLLASSDCYHPFPADSPNKQVETIWTQCTGRRTLIYAPLFHAAGIFTAFMSTIYYDWKPVFAPIAPFTADKAAEIIQTGLIEDMFIISGILSDMVKTPSHLEILKRLGSVVAGGAAIPKILGDEIVKRTRFINALTATETAAPPCIQNREDWDYVSFPPEAGVEFRLLAGTEGLHESVILTHISQIFVFRNGEKLNPVILETDIGFHPQVNGCLVVGTGKFEATLIVEPKVPVETAAQRAAFINDIWPQVEKANEVCVAHGRISRDLILLTRPDKPLSRTAKGSIQRQKNADAYKTEIDELYATVDRVDIGETSSTLDSTSISTLTNSLHQYLISILGLGSIQPEDDLFEFGLDSLQILRAVRNINRKFGKEILDSRMVIDNPTIGSLSNSMWAQIHNQYGEVDNDDKTKQIEQMDTIFKQLSHDLPAMTGSAPQANSKVVKVVMVTGTTGSLGCYLLHWLLKDASVKHIYCLNRSSDARERQVQGLRSKGLSTSFDSPRVTFHQFQVGKPGLGMPQPEYDEMVQHVTHVYHNAWPVNFQLPLGTFTPHLKTVRYIIDFSSQSVKKAHVIFVSSVSAVLQWRDNSPVPEQVVEDWTVAAPMGYSQSKLVSERLLNEAAKTSGVSSTVWRAGQIAGSLNEEGLWNRSEWVPSLIASSRYLGVIPDNLSTMDQVDWIPIDLLAQAMVQSLHVAGDENVSETRVFHGVTPITCHWSDLLPSVLESFPSLRKVPYSEWFQQLQRSASDIDQVRQNPAIKLLDFFHAMTESRTLPIRSTTKTVQYSPVMARLPGVNGDWMRIWIRQWNAADKV